MKTLIFDYHGTLGNDVGIYDGILNELERLKKSHQIIIFSNATFLSKDAEISYSKKNLIKGLHFDHVITSGQIFCDTLMQKHKFFKVFEKDGPFKDYNKFLTNDINNADFIYISIPDLKDGQSIYLKDLKYNGKQISIDEIIQFDLFDELKVENTLYAQMLSEVDDTIKRNTLNLPFIVANPDLTATVNQTPALRQGFIGAYLRFKNQKIVFFGKPVFSSIQDVLEKYNINPSETKFFGDLLYTDILSANLFNIEAILCEKKDEAINFKTFEKILNIMEIQFNEKLKYQSIKSLSDYLLQINS